MGGDRGLAEATPGHCGDRPSVSPACQPVWPSGKAEGPRFESASALLSLRKLWFVDTDCDCPGLTINETLNWLLELPILMQESFL